LLRQHASTTVSSWFNGPLAVFNPIVKTCENTNLHSFANIAIVFKCTDFAVAYLSDRKIQVIYGLGNVGIYDKMFKGNMATFPYIPKHQNGPVK
jgi:hypothetical protein